MNRLRIVGITILGLALIVLWLNWPANAFGDETLFSDAPSTSAASTAAQGSGITRERTVRISWNALSPHARQLRLNLFDDVVMTADQLRVDQAGPDGYVWVGRINGQPDSLVTLSVRSDLVVGSVRLEGLERYRVVAAETGVLGGNIHRIQEIDPMGQIEPNGIDAIVPKPSAEELLQFQDDGAEMCDDGSIIDLLIAYTAAARDAVGGTDAMKALIDLRVSEMNSANLDSAAGFEWRLADSMEVTYDESGNLMLDLDRLRIVDDLHMDGVHLVREAAHADVVNLVVSMGTDGACGLAYQMNELQPWFGDYAFGISALDYEGDYSCSSLTMTHEIGHGMGNAHDIANAGGAALFPYSYGFQDPAGAFRTIMAYDCEGESCPRINHWSNPNVQFNGAPTGIAYDSGANLGADVIRSMGEASEMVANFKTSCVVEPPTETPTITPVPDSSPQPSETPLPTATDTPTVEPTATDSEPQPSETPDIPSPSPTATDTPTSTPTTKPASTATPTMTPSPTTLSPTATGTPLPPLPFVLQIPVVLNISD